MKPGDFFLGVLDFFAVLLPGSMAAWLVTRYIPPPMLKAALTFDLRGAEAQTSDLIVASAFLIASYLLGHFVFIAGSMLDASYDLWRRRAHPMRSDQTYKAARAVRDKVTPELQNSGLSVLKWARAYIQVKSAAARPEIDRLEAEQKFFRGLVVVGPILAAHFFVGEQSLLAGAASVAFSALAYQRYLDRRWAMTELIFATAVIVNAAGGSESVASKMAALDQRGGAD